MDADIAAIDAWLADDKTLEGVFPGWGKSYGRDFTARWGIVDSAGIQSGELSFTVDRALLKPSIAVVTDRKMVARIDLVPETECEPNPFGALALGLPPQVCGSHIHRWEHNREWVRIQGFGELPFREPTPKALKTLEQALATIAGAVNLTFTAEQGNCQPPSQGDLF